ncbi:hypothetical protein GCM10027614_01830 [Micromonospora vulcania]
MHLRAQHVTEYRSEHRLPSAEAVTMAAAAYTMDHPKLYEAAQRAARLSRFAGRRGGGLPPPLSGWTIGRDLPQPPPQTFREWWASR